MTNGIQKWIIRRNRRNCITWDISRNVRIPLGKNNLKNKEHGKVIHQNFLQQAFAQLLKRFRPNQQHTKKLRTWLDRLAHFVVSVKHVVASSLKSTDYLGLSPGQISNTQKSIWKGNCSDQGIESIRNKKQVHSNPAMFTVHSWREAAQIETIENFKKIIGTQGARRPAIGKISKVRQTVIHKTDFYWSSWTFSPTWKFLTFSRTMSENVLDARKKQTCI